MAHGVVSEMLTPEASPTGGAKHPSTNHSIRKNVGVMGSRRIFAPTFKLKVLASYRNDVDCRGNQRATARKYNIHRRQIQKWLQCEASLRNCAASSIAADSHCSSSSPSPDSMHPAQQQQHQQQPAAAAAATLNPSRARLHGDEQQQQPPPLPQPTQQPQPSQQASAAAAATSYRFLPQPHYDYPPQHHLIYPTPTPVQYQYAGFQPPVVRYTTPVDEPMITEIKRERASPDSSPIYHHHHHQHYSTMKKERLDDEVCNTSYSSGISDQASSSSSPAPSHLESLPPSPRESTGSSGSDSDASDSQLHSSMMLGVNNPTAPDLAKRRSFSLRFKLKVLDAFHSDKHCKQNQRATARKFSINRRQVQKWLGQEHDLRDTTQHRGANRQRLGSHSPSVVLGCYSRTTEDKWQQVKRERFPSHSPNGTNEETPVDLRTGGMEYNYCEMSPNSYADTALTPPYSQTGCTLSCCSQEQPPTYYCYSPPQQLATCGNVSNNSSQEQPLCLVKPKAEPVSSTVPTPPAPVASPPKKDAILFKPYLDNPVVSKPAPASPSNNNNSQDALNLNALDVALDVSFRPQFVQPQAPYHFEIPQARSAFVRYPAYLQ